MLDFAWWLLSYIAPFLLVLTIIVFVHEMGHYLVARWNGIAIHTFSVGFGREIVGFTDKLGTRWRLSMIPLGGYVRFLGDMNVASLNDPDALEKFDPQVRPHLFSQKSVWRRIAVVVAGPIANIIFTFVVLYGLLLGYGQYVTEPIIQEVLPNSVAAEAGVQAGDRVLLVDGYSVRSFSDFQRLVSTSPQRQVTILLDRLDREIEILVVPEIAMITDRFGNEHRVGRIGVSRSVSADDVVKFYPDPIEAIFMATEEMVFLVDRTFAFLADFFVGRGDVEQLGGPIKVAQVSGNVATLGLIALINLTALLSLNIGIFNLFPIPMLDGGHLVFYLVEAAKGRPLSQRIQEIGFRFGMAIVFSLMVFTLINDIF